jgi:hypothetical protein
MLSMDAGRAEIPAAGAERAAAIFARLEKVVPRDYTIKI